MADCVGGVGARFGATSDPNSDSEDVPEGSAGVERIGLDEPMDGFKGQWGVPPNSVPMAFIVCF